MRRLLTPQAPRRRTGGRDPLAGAAVVSLMLHAAALFFLGWWYAAPHEQPGNAAPARAPLEWVRLLTPAPPAPSTPEAQPTASAEDEEDEEDEDQPAERPPPAAPVPAMGTPARPPLFRSGFSDARLHADPGTLRLRGAPAPPSARERVEARLQAENAAAAGGGREARESRRIDVFGRSLTVLGDSAAATARRGGMAVSGERMVMPEDGREWMEQEMARQRTEAVRDSIMRERIRATRERKEAAEGD